MQKCLLCRLLLNRLVYHFIFDSFTYGFCSVCLQLGDFYVVVNFLFQIFNFGFSFVSNSFAYITIPKNNGKIKIT